MIKRHLKVQLISRLRHAPAVVLLGPRQVGKTTLALEVAQEIPSIYLDLESDSERAKLKEPEIYLAEHADRLVILDEIHRVPDLFPLLRGLIDKSRRTGVKAGLFLLLGSASIDLLRQGSETLAGRISFIELNPLDILEVGAQQLNSLWLRGGFPESFLAVDDEVSMQWRRDFISTYLERDIPQLGPRIPAVTLGRFWTMLAHHQGGLLNASQFARGLGVDGKTVVHYLDLLVDLLLVRRLSPWHHNQGKRLIRSPKIYIRDSGLLHTLLKVRDREMLFGHPIIGQSWEGFAIETLLSVAPTGVEASFYRTSTGAEIDLLLQLPTGALWAIEIKRSLTPKPERGFHIACDELKPNKRFIVYAGAEKYPLGNAIEAISLYDLAKLLASVK